MRWLPNGFQGREAAVIILALNGWATILGNKANQPPFIVEGN